MIKIIILSFFLFINSGCAFAAFETLKYIDKKVGEANKLENEKIMFSENCRNVDYYLGASEKDS